jgi:hypothetical protein
MERGLRFVKALTVPEGSGFPRVPAPALEAEPSTSRVEKLWLALTPCLTDKRGWDLLEDQSRAVSALRSSPKHW